MLPPSSLVPPVWLENPDSERSPVPCFTTSPPPEMPPANDELPAGFRTSRPPVWMVTSPEMLPDVPSPTWSVPAVIAVPPA
jgi:hypothetical protein